MTLKEIHDAGKATLALLHVDAPPCPGCKHWQPAIVTGGKGDFQTVRLCHAAEQYRDFSCFREDPSKIPEPSKGVPRRDCEHCGSPWKCAGCGVLLKDTQ